MTTPHRTLLQQSLEALSADHHFGDYDALCAALREALEAPEPEPVAAPARVPLPFSKAQLHRLYVNSPELHKDAASEAAFTRIVQLAEAAHGIGGSNGNV